MYTKENILESLKQLPPAFSLEELLQVLLGSPLSGSFEAGSFLPDEKPSAYAGIWENDDRTAEQIREEAWQRKVFY